MSSIYFMVILITNVSLCRGARRRMLSFSSSLSEAPAEDAIPFHGSMQTWSAPGFAQIPRLFQPLRETLTECSSWRIFSAIESERGFLNISAPRSKSSRVIGMTRP